uniref:Uncharacterized protein n=1 Tax=Candidatus Kentrum sp. FW TaxID=2126338 RepID=A0A450U093_9GAMM|nr:MAG: hypothetical protein BECKFW1821C_GA0114237_10869 [Candidatus Kentron sp. FW]
MKISCTVNSALYHRFTFLYSICPGIRLFPAQVYNGRSVEWYRGPYTIAGWNWQSGLYTTPCLQGCQYRNGSSSKSDTLTRGPGTSSLSPKHGNPVLVAEGKSTLVGFREGVDGDGVITQTNHIMDSSGYSTSLNAETPKE